MAALSNFRRNGFGTYGESAHPGAGAAAVLDWQPVSDVATAIEEFLG